MIEGKVLGSPAHLNSHPSLEFTGNWFVDAGIMGFVNLMEEVYGWDLETFNKKIREIDNAILYFGLFPIAYFYDWLINREYKTDIIIPSVEDLIKKFANHSEMEIFEICWWNYIMPMFKNAWVNKRLDSVLSGNFNGFPEEIQEVKKKEEEIKEFETSIKNFLKVHNELIKKILKKKKDVRSLNLDMLQRLFEILDENIKENLSEEFIVKLKDIKNKFDIITSYFTEIWLNAKKILNDANSNKIEKFLRLPIDSSFYKNFLFFNTSKGLLAQKKALWDLLTFNLDEKMLQKIDKAINKLLPSENDFPNVLYTPLQTSSMGLSDYFIYFLCFTKAFKTNINGKKLFFYSPSLSFTHKVNKRIYILSSSYNENFSLNLLKITWQSIIDTIFEYKSSWYLENMYLIEYQRLDNQVQEGVEYIGISKLQAIIILDDTLRNALNGKIKRRDKEKSLWILEEFIKNNPLYPIILEHTYMAVKGKTTLKKSTSIYSLAVEYTKTAVVGGDLNKQEYLFVDFFNKQREFRDFTIQIKNVASEMFYISRISRSIFYEDVQSNKKFLMDMFIPILKSDQKEFVNRLLKNLIGKDKNESSKLISYIFKNILDNAYWKYWALPIVMGVIGGGKNE